MKQLGSVAVIDLGSARAKLTVGMREASGDLVLERQSRDTGVAAILNADGILGGSVLAHLVQVTTDLAEVARKSGAERLLTIATEAFRRCSNLREVIARLEPIVGPIVVSNPETEGAILYTGLVSIPLLESSSFCVVDIGGGSIQIHWGPNVGDGISLAAGTYVLEKRFQRGSPMTIQEAERLGKWLRSQVTGLPKSLRLVVGTNCMASYYRAMSARFGIPLQSDLGSFVVMGASAAASIARGVVGTSYDVTRTWFDSNPSFMYGADKASVAATAIAQELGSLELIATDESVSSATVRLMLAGKDVAWLSN